ncbi:MAG: indolepyruvate ferredoxin oxidoreductase, partial [Chlorobiaceae bacterium]|nr:indolepyruvate ferredoxin oxidoreductase [Chlorobiaceae bacterium]
LRGYFNNSAINGRLDGTLPRAGELSADNIRSALGITEKKGLPIPSIMVNRPPELCKGCGHRDMFDALNAVMKTFAHSQVFSDIGCYTLGALPPFNAIHTCVDMGASITMAKGAADAGLHPAVAVIGDSTFAHSGMTGLLDAVNDRTSLTVIIADNDTTAMTGGQQSSATGSRIVSLCIGLGVDKAHIRTIIPLKTHLGKNISVLNEELNYAGVSVVIAQRECIEAAAKKKRQQAAKP